MVPGTNNCLKGNLPFLLKSVSPGPTGLSGYFILLFLVILFLMFCKVIVSVGAVCNCKTPDVQLCEIRLGI